MAFVYSVSWFLATYDSLSVGKGPVAWVCCLIASRHSTLSDRTPIQKRKGSLCLAYQGKGNFRPGR